MKNAESIFANAIAKLQTSDFVSAEKLFAKVVRLRPGHTPSLLNLAIAQQAQGKLRDAEITLQKVIRVDPANVDANLMLSRLLLMPDRFHDVLKIYEKILRTNPFILEVHCNKAAVLNEIGRHEDAMASAIAALEINSKHVESLLNYGNALFNLGRYEESWVAHRRALEVEPNNQGNLLGLGNALVELKRHDEALAIYQRLLGDNPTLEGARVGRANLYFDAKRYQDALADYDKVLAVRPDLAKAWLGRGNVSYNLKRYEEAFADYDKAFSINANLEGVDSARLYLKMHLADWSRLQSECDQLIRSVRSDKKGISPFFFLSVPSTAEDQLKCSQVWVANKYPASIRPVWQGEKYAHDRIRVAYFSSDLREHPVSFLLAGMFECHDKSRFEITALSSGPDDNSQMRRRLKDSFERFIDVNTYADDQIAMLVKQLEIDILVDLTGFTADARTNVLAKRPAPIQVNYLGYPGTMGAPYIDYIIADRTVIPEGHDEFYSEKIAALPNCYMANDSKRRISDRVFTRGELGLPETGFVYCCFNNSYKLTPRTFDCWIRILQQVENSVLWLLVDNATAVGNLRKEAAARGVLAEQLIFANRTPLLSDHLARYRLADLFLDTLPYNAHTTASDALWAGLPVLTCLGQTFAGRVAASLLGTIGLPELITTTLEAYERTAIDVAEHPEKLATIKRKLAENRPIAPLFDTKLFTKHIEAAYSAMHDRHRAGLSPDHILIPS